MKLNDFFEKTTKARVPPNKIITVTNERRERALVDEVTALTKQVNRVRDLENENLKLSGTLQTTESHLAAVTQNEQKLKSANELLKVSATEGDMCRSDNQQLRIELTNLTNQLVTKEAGLTQAQQNNTTLTVKTETLAKQLNDLRAAEANVQTQLNSSLQQTSTSLAHLTQMREKLENTDKMFQATEVKYIEGQHTNHELTDKVIYWTSVANTLQEERDELEQTRKMLKELAITVEADNVEKKGAVKVTQTELKKLRRTVGTMTMNMDGLVQENQSLSETNSALKGELARPKYMAMSAIQHSDGFKLPIGGYRKNFLGNSKPTLLKFKREDNYDN